MTGSESFLEEWKRKMLEQLPEIPEIISSARISAELGRNYVAEQSLPFIYWTDPVFSLSMSDKRLLIRQSAATEFASQVDIDRIMNIFVVPDAAPVHALLAKYPALRIFERGWWFGAMDRARGKLAIDLF